MYITADSLIQLAAVLTACGTIIAIVFTVFKWIANQKKQDEDIKALKKETGIICEAIRSCLDGLEQLGANHSVTASKNKLDEHLNEKAHE